MMLSLQDPVRSLKGIGEKKAQAFAKLGVFSLYDLLSFYPRRYEDRSTIKPIALTCSGESVCIRALIANDPQLVRIRKGMELLKFSAVDETGMIRITYFNQNWMKNRFRRGEEYIFYGKIEAEGAARSMVNPVAEKADIQERFTGRIIPVYKSGGSLTQKEICQCMNTALTACSVSIEDPIPLYIREKLCLTDIQTACRAIHFPLDFNELVQARRRLVFEELFILACAMGSRRFENTSQCGITIQCPDLEQFYNSLPFSPTEAQRRAVSDALRDMSSGRAMSRLIQGDVGSGKTLCAAALIWAAARNGLLTVFMAPTEILTEQHFHTLSSLLSPFGIRILKLTGSMNAREKEQIRSALLSRKADLVVGTHALFSEKMEYPGIGLVITDEQHRFGVAQRGALIQKGTSPHVLVMSATPIPRTLALIIYGDLDVSILDERPPGRQDVDTFAVDSRYRQRLNRFLQKQAEEGHQSFVICPSIEDTEENSLNLHSVETYTRELQSQLPGCKVACIHGRMKAKEKDAIMEAFSRSEIDILVATTVVEVGVDVPNATLIVIENAERFGLSQLHQLRGRVGRGPHKSYCILVSDTQTEETKERLSVLCRTNDGFRISEEDLRLRGPGDFLGSRQHGLPEMHITDLGADAAILQQAKEEAEALLSSDPFLSLPEHQTLRNRAELLLRSGTPTLN